jgi:hypothetical protein
MFSCTGKVAGFLSHKLMVQAPQMQQDYVFIVVPDTWIFHDKTMKAPISIPSQIATLDKKSSTANFFDKSKFLSPSKRQPREPSTPTASAATVLPPVPAASSLDYSYDSPSSSSLSSKRPNEDEIHILAPSAKKPCPAANTFHHNAPSTASNNHKPNHPSSGSTIYFFQPQDSGTNANIVPYSIPLLPLQSHDETTRPHRSRQVPKKYATVD